MEWRLVVVLLPLVAHTENGHGPRVLDLEQRHVPGILERNDQLAQKRTTGTSDGFAARERKDFQYFNRLGNRGLGMFGRRNILVKQEIEQPQEVLVRFQCEADSETAHVVRM